jgi:hypothetical protein
MLVKSSKRSRSNHKKHNNKKYKKHATRKAHKSKSRNNKLRKSRMHKNRSHKHSKHQRGGFTNCSLATVQEPGFNITAIGEIPGFSIPDSKGVIYRPNCKTDTYQAMIPSS